MSKKWIFDNRAFAHFQTLMDIVSPSMDEVPMATYLRDKWRQAGANVTTDVMGNIYASVGNGHPLNLGLIAHMDTVAVQITKILPGGHLQMRHIGLRPHTLLGQAMKVVTRNGIIEGVIGFDPTSQYGQPKGLVEEDLWMDIGAESYEEAEEMVQVGDLAVLAPRFVKMGPYALCGTAIDDRVGLFVIDECLTWFADHAVAVNLYFMGSVQEEVGLRGAAVTASNVKLDACITVDVDYATDTPTPHENQMGTLHLGKGVGLHVKADINPVLRRIALETACENNIPYQQSVGRFIYGGTDSTALQVQKAGIATLNANIPCRYMHSPVEMCDTRDIESCIRLIISLIEKLGRTGLCRFIPGCD